MAKTSFASLKLKVDESTKSFEIDGKEIEVKQYLPIADKYAIATISITNSLEDGIVNPIKLEAIFNLYLVLYYTDIVFTDKQKEDSLKLYDILESNGIINKVRNLIPDSEYTMIFDAVVAMKESVEMNKASIAGVVDKLLTDWPAAAEAVSQIVNNFDAEKYENVTNFAKAIGAK